MKRNYFLLFILVFASIFGYAQTQNPYFITINTEYDVTTSIDSGGTYLRGWDDLTPIILTQVNDDGTVSVCSFDSETQDTYIYEYSEDLQFLKTIKIHNEFNKFGCFTRDNDGNYYIVCAEDVQERAFQQKNLVLVKYDPDGNKTEAFYLAAQTSDEIWARGYSGIRNPFYAGSCRLEISGDWIAVYFARRMFRAGDGKNHQASYGFILDKNNLQRIQGITMPSAGHSFNQFILPIENGFIFSDHGDNGPRGFNFARVQQGLSTKNLKSFVFKKGKTYQYTFAQMGGLAQTSNGYIFTGGYEKNTTISHQYHNDSRNVFILTFDDQLTSCSKPVWITNYTDKNENNAANPKIADLGSGRYLLMWEFMTQYAYKSTFIKIINEKGEPLSEETEIPNIRLNINDVLRYNKNNGNVYWAGNNGRREIIVYSLNPEKLINTEIRNQNEEE